MNGKHTKRSRWAVATPAPTEKTAEKREKLVEDILACRGVLQYTPTETEHLETKIDHLVFELYEFTEKEKKVVLRD